MALVVYRRGGIEVAVGADGRVRMAVEPPGEGGWAAELDPVVWPRVVAALVAEGLVGGTVGGTVGGAVGGEPSEPVVVDVPVPLLDLLVRAVATGVGPYVAHRRVRTEEGARGEPGAAAFGEVRGVPAVAVGGRDRSFALYEVPGGTALGVSTAAGTAIRAVALGRDSVAVAGDDHLVRVWDLGSGRQLPVRAGHGGRPVRSLACHGALVLSAGDGVRAWDGRSGAALGALDHESSAVCLVEAGGRRLIAMGTESGLVRLVDAASGRPVHVLGCGPGWVNAVAGGNGLVAAGGAGGVIRVWDAATGRELHELIGHAESVVGLAFAGAELASCALDGTVRIWAAGEQVRAWAIGDEWPTGLASGVLAGRPVLVTGGEQVRVWDTTGKLLRALPLRATSVAVSGSVSGAVSDAVPGAVLGAVAAGASVTGEAPGGLVAVGSAEGTVTVLDGDALVRERASEPRVRYERESGDGAVTALAFGADGLVSGTGDGAVRVHEPGTGEVAVVPTPHLGQVLALAFHDGLLVSGGMDRAVRVWDAATGLPLRRLLGPREGVTAVAVAELDGRAVVAATGYDRDVRTWDAATGRPLLAIHDVHQGPGYALAFGEAGGRAVIASGGHDGRVPVLDARTGHEVVTLAPNPGTVLSLRLSGDTLLVGCDDGTVRRWSLPGGELLGETRAPVLPLALSDGYAAGPDGLAGIGL
ncbi:WD40 repeat domain-containing protein [Nonomuraea sp. NPDC000554]|uniref:WD40 repeat domain-containing protein n=1 Tax=Nonomuraea sp. NPDC000554 TaxID=3154259 RepID=UPI00331F1AAB